MNGTVHCNLTPSIGGRALGRGPNYTTIADEEATICDHDGMTMGSRSLGEVSLIFARPLLAVLPYHVSLERQHVCTYQGKYYLGCRP